MVPNGAKWFQMVQNGFKWFQIVQFSNDPPELPPATIQGSGGSLELPGAASLVRWCGPVIHWLRLDALLPKSLLSN
jgi:hypothetical protein